MDQEAPYGNGGGDENNDNSSENLVMPPPPDIPIINLQKYLNCFNTNMGASITIYAEKMGNGNGVGHAFISISQGNNIMVFGFYPQNVTSSLMGEGIMGENGGHHYNVSANLGAISSDKLQKIINLALNYDMRDYDLSFNNCSDFADDVMNIAGIQTTGWIDTPNTVANILMTLPNHNLGSFYAPNTNRNCP